MFSKAGDVLRVIMGLDKQQRTPCGFAFGEERRRTLPCVCVSLGGVERGKGGGRGGEEEGREGEKLTFFDTKKTFFFNLGSGLLRPLRRRGRRQVPQRGRARREADPSRLRLGFRRGEAVRAVRPSERKKSEFIFLGGGASSGHLGRPFSLISVSPLLFSPLPPSLPLSLSLSKKNSGRSGGQVRDEYRHGHDPGRGGWGAMVRAALEQQQQQEAGGGGGGGGDYDSVGM